MNPALRLLKPYPMAELQARKAALAKTGKTIFDFGTGDPIEPTPAFIPEALRRAVPEVSQYPSVAGTPHLRQAAAGYLLRRFGVTLNPDTQVLPAAGSKEAIFHLPLAFLDPGSGRDTVIHGTPGYPVYQAGALFAGGREHPVVLTRERGWRLELERLPVEVLKRNEVLWVQGDMHLTDEEAAREQMSIPVPFLWGTAALHTGPVRLAKVFGAPILPCLGYRDGLRIVLEIGEPLTLRAGSTRADLRADLRAYLDRLEPLIRARPDQWAFTRHEILPHWIKTAPAGTTTWPTSART